ncbi:hypothetical protein [Nonomuraea endophytica]|uniref:hypothetical protein n=1 Tax=Nonomuraea endophytica TaxID=714136 RepID=UPI0037CBDA28
MTAWLVAEGFVQLVRLDRVAMLTLKPLDGRGDDKDPLRNVYYAKYVRLLAGLSGPPEQAAVCLLTVPGRSGARVLQELTEVIEEVERRVQQGGIGCLYIHGPLPRFADHDPRRPIWQLAAELPEKNWPTTVSVWNPQGI